MEDKNFHDARSLVKMYSSRVTTAEIEQRLKLIESLSLLYQGQLKEAEHSSSSLIGTKYYSDLKSLIDVGKNMKHKSPVLAGLLSALIPGLGKVYCERTRDGIVSFFVVGMVSGLTYYFYRDRGITPEVVILGTLDAGYYLGNIYGSAMAARVYNYEQHQDFLRALDQKAGIWFEYSY